MPEGITLLRILKFCHHAPLAGHFGHSNIQDLGSRKFWWPAICASVASCVDSCDLCTRTKIAPFKTAGSRPAPTHFALDLGHPSHGLYHRITTFPRPQYYSSGGWPLTQAGTFCSMPGASAQGTVCLFVNNIFCLHGLPIGMVSDQEVQFISHFWQEFLCHLSIDTLTSMTFYTSTKSQAEWVNQVLEQYLHYFLNLSSR